MNAEHVSNDTLELVMSNARSNVVGPVDVTPDTTESEQPRIENGTLLGSSNGVVYRVEHLQAHQVQVRARDCVGYQRDPNADRASIDLVVPRVFASLTLRRAIPKIRGKAARALDKKLRRLDRENRRHLETSHEF